MAGRREEGGAVLVSGPRTELGPHNYMEPYPAEDYLGRLRPSYRTRTCGGRQLCSLFEDGCDKVPRTEWPATTEIPKRHCDASPSQSEWLSSVQLILPRI